MSVPNTTQNKQERKPEDTGFVHKMCLSTDSYIRPRIIHNFISVEEKDHIMKKAEPLLKDSIVLGNQVNKDIRSSQTAWLYRSDPRIQAIIERAAEVTGLPVENAESLQVVRYEINQEYKAHHDATPGTDPNFFDFCGKKGNRVRTVLIYLTTDFEGGHTHFPALKLKVKPPELGAIIFHTLNENGTCLHPYALHGGLPVTKGTKWICNVWFREKTFSFE